jgi:hypothetical protein
MVTRAERPHLKEAEDKQWPHGAVVYRAVYKEGTDELATIGEVSLVGGTRARSIHGGS